MPRRHLRIPITTGIPRATFQLSLEAWARVETAFGRPIPTDTRGRIEEGTRDYLQLAAMEEKAAPLTFAFEEIAATRKAAQELIERLTAIHSCKSDVHS